MISKTSFFNRGIYKATVKRFSWGGILYFVLLFTSTVLSLFLNIDRDFARMPQNFFEDYAVILNGSYMAIPMLLAIAVPTVAALLVFSFMHSKKQALFIGSLPASKPAVFVSMLAAAFALMFVPVLLNGTILAILSLSGYGLYFSVLDCLLWVGYNLFGLFTLFSVAAFAAFLTGNSFAAAGLNALLHGGLFLLVATFSVMAEAFLFGFVESTTIYETLMENNFVVTVYGFMNDYFRQSLAFLDILKFLGISVLFYIAAFLLYRARRVETAGDVAGFRCLHPIFKYLVTLLATLTVFAIFVSYMHENAVVFGVILALASLIAYAASEMLLKKTRNILYSYKGYLAFLVCFAAVTCLFAFTSFFGFESRVPELDAISRASLYTEYRYEKPLTDDPAMIREFLDIHEALISPSEIPLSRHEKTINGPYVYLNLQYELKNGRTLSRAYVVPEEKRIKIMNAMYENEAYKKLCEPIFMEDSAITRILVMGKEPAKNHEALLEALRADVLALPYEALHPYYYDSDAVLYHLEVEYREAEEDDVFRTRYAHYPITAKFENTCRHLEEKGYIAEDVLLD